MVSSWKDVGTTAPALERSHVVQAFVDLYGDARYLEIGVCTGRTFHDVRADRKVAVDPQFLFDVTQARATRHDSTYHETSSDAFFHSIVGDETFHVIFIDGLHTYEQCLRDLLNAISCLEDGGVIIVDDVKPLDYASSLPDEADARALRDAFGISDGRWMGDVYKVVFFIAGYLGGFSFATVSETYGQTVLWREPRRVIPDFSLDAIAKLQFADVVRRTDVYRMARLDEIVQRFRTGAGGPAEDPDRAASMKREMSAESSSG